jgi:hypothetical protein
MLFSGRELITSLHGLVLGSVFLLSYTGGMVELWSLRHDWATPHGVRTHLRRLVVGTWVMAIAGWVTVITGAYLVFPLYRASPPPATANLSAYPKALILAHPDLTVLQTIGMSWKEHIAWFAPILATAVAFVVTRYGPHLVSQPRIRQAAMALFTMAFVAAGIAGAFGAFLDKAAPVR